MINLETMFKAYVACALWSSTNGNSEPMDENYGAEDIADDAMATMKSECAGFIRSIQPIIKDHDDNAGASEYVECLISDDQFGHDFWLTRNGHGAGFWDRGLGKLGNDLSTAAETFGSSDLYVGDDARVYVA